jgi:1-acyl-sn-glycerol-3-phosphate acyltransferase
MTAKKVKHIDRRSFFRYDIVKIIVGILLKKLFYRKVTYSFEEPVPENVPVVFAANHQNALMDALLIIFATPLQPVFFARADIFRKNLLRKILTYLKIAPLYRIRDGRDTMHRNADSFDLATEILTRRNSIGIFPEGTHHDKEQLIPLKKGMARMVLKAEYMHDFHLGVHVIPVSISYSDYIKPRAEVRVHMGKALTFRHLKELYETNQPLALTKLNEEFYDALKSITLDVEHSKYYYLIQNMRKSLVREAFGKKAQLNRSFDLSFQFIENMNQLLKNNPESVKGMLKRAEKYYSSLSALGISEPMLIEDNQNALLFILRLLFLVAGFPVFVAGFVLNYFPFIMLYQIVNRKVKDTQFRSSVYFAANLLFVAPLMYLIQAVVSAVVFSSVMAGLIAIPVMLLSGLFACRYIKNFKKSSQLWKANRFFSKNSLQATELREQRENFMKELFEFTDTGRKK